MRRTHPWGQEALVLYERPKNTFEFEECYFTEGEFTIDVPLLLRASQVISKLDGKLPFMDDEEFLWNTFKEGLRYATGTQQDN